MAIIGRAFAFYIKYWNEMDALLHGEEGTGALLKTVPKRERQELMEQIKAVGERAGEQAAALLNECGQEIEHYFSESLGCEASRYSRESTIEKDWAV